MTKAPNLFLVGPMGAGKSTVGRQLAKALGWQFLDSDTEIERLTGAAIPWIFDIEGEAGFRRRERAVIEDLTRGERIVLATGGGVVLDPDNREHLKSRGVVVYLNATVDHLCDRTSKDRNRPLLQVSDPRARLAELLAQREPLYRDVADVVVDTGGRTVRGAVKDILARIQPLLRKSHFPWKDSSAKAR